MANGVRLPVHGHVPTVPKTHWLFFPGAGLGNCRSASGVVLAPEVQPGPTQICTVNGT